MGVTSKKTNLKIDLGCAGIRREGFIHVDNVPGCQPDVVMDMQEYVKTLDTNSVSEAVVSHSIEFLDGWEIIEFMNELHRIIRSAGTIKISVTAVMVPSGKINPRAWTAPWLKTHFSPDTFKVFTGGSSYRHRGVLPWTILENTHLAGGGLVVLMTPVKGAELTAMRKKLGMDQ